jgi:hypothetical protein
MFLGDMYKLLEVNYPKFFKMDALSKLCFLAAELLLEAGKDNSNTALYFANSQSSLNTDVKFEATTVGDGIPSPSLFVYTLPNVALGEICIRHKIYGENIFFIGEKDSAIANLLLFAQTSLEQNPSIDKALVGWVDCRDEHFSVIVYLVEP